jgi:hypothetical protein
MAWMNIGGGLHHNKPIKGVWDTELESWWCKDGDYDAKKLGLNDQGFSVCYVSFDKKEVQLWIDGARAFRKIMSHLFIEPKQERRKKNAKRN